VAIATLCGLANFPVPNNLPDILANGPIASDFRDQPVLFRDVKTAFDAIGAGKDDQFRQSDIFAGTEWVS